MYNSMLDLKDYFFNLVNSIEGSIYWKDKNGVYLGCNKYAANMVGIWGPEEIIGKTDYDLFDKDTADIFRKHDLKVLTTELKLILEEESKLLEDGSQLIQLSSKSPLYDKDNKLIGIIGNTINITDKREKEKLRLENERQKQSIIEQENFRQIVDQVSHDIRSPLSSLAMLTASCNGIEEEDRIAIREAIHRINDIANNLLNEYKPNKEALNLDNREPFLISTALLEIISEKKFQYKAQNIKFEHKFSAVSNFAFTNMEAQSFKRMISNLINNAIDATDKANCCVVVELELDNQMIQLKIKDNGRGMSENIKEKILNNIAITDGKSGGHGIGLVQVRDTIVKNSGKLAIESIIGKGTTITLTFPVILAPLWIADKLEINMGDTIVVLDDDPSIHGAWYAKFKKLSLPNITIKHFNTGEGAIEFISSLSSTDKEHIFLLTDYELLNQPLNGLDVIKQLGIKRSILVTSHYARHDIQKEVIKLDSKILPKMLAVEVNIHINEDNDKQFNYVDLVLLEDDIRLVKSILKAVPKGKIVDVYSCPEELLVNLDKYKPTTKIMFDNSFEGSEISGLQLSYTLKELGYSNLYLCSGNDFSSSEFNHLKLLPKSDTDLLFQFLKLI